MKNSDDVDLLYILQDHGWSACYIYVNGHIYELVMTHVFDNPIEVFLGSLTTLLEGTTEVEFVWRDEPGEYRWNILRDSAQRHIVEIEITNCRELRGSEVSKLNALKFQVKLKHFCICVLRQMEKIRDLMTEKRFSEHRRNQFPHASFQSFKSSFVKSHS